ncbi:hypothetical protein [Streptomyces lanatus]|uniref:Integral membrane protein n=1 Tax=Streptomyces lanatus TaxID=66900 RepID=A0ABV1XQU3_9ACTN|nr:hypothetical protein [Streptomyces lanatus]GHH06105.1 hypothetical protein GCM10018780_38560 [Streptomyces lanatus]
MSEARASWFKGAVSGVLLVIGYLLAGAATAIAYLSNPLGPWDHQAFDHIRLFGRLGLTFALLTAPVVILAVTRRWLRPWWIVPCAVIMLAVWGRLTVFFPAR